MSAFNELHPVIQNHIKSWGMDSFGDALCGCVFRSSTIYGRDVAMCQFHTGMSVGVEEALEWEEGVDER